MPPSCFSDMENSYLPSIKNCFVCHSVHILSLQDTPVVPIGRSPRTDVLLNAEKVVLEFGGVVLRLAGLYISFMVFEL